MIYTGMVKDIRKFIDNLCESALEAAWSFNYAHKTIFQDTTHMIEEKVTWALFKKNTEFNCTLLLINNRFIKYLKLTNNLLPTLEIMKERRYDLYGDNHLATTLQPSNRMEMHKRDQEIRPKKKIPAHQHIAYERTPT
ncbi:hypothetical protein RIR_jg16000.t1 [Rhizophagus irregularis DAOM 181602=DAOM 197198]|nr:hypothetical protein RIR_jg16000.t1 [Rhizophagus irregularis DAOM 181602=DAOM 197198]